MSDLIAVLRRRWVIVVVSALIVPVVAVAMSGRDSTNYGATATVLLVDGVPDEVAKILPAGVAKHSDRNFAARIALAVSEDVAAVVVERLEVDQDDVLHGISATSDVAKNTIDFDYANEDPELAADVVNAYADAYAEVARELQEQRLDAAVEAAYAIAEESAKKIRFVDLPEDFDARFVADVTLGDGAYEGMLHLADRMALSATVQEDPVVVIEYAEPADTSSGTVGRMALLALIGGIFLGVMLALLAEYMDRRRETQVS